MKKILLFLLIFSSFAYSENVPIYITQQKEIHKLDSSLQKTNFEISELKRKLEVEENLNNQIINGTSFQLNFATYTLGILAIVITITAIFLGVYVTRIERKIINLKEESIALLNETEKNKKKVVSINNLIQNNVKKLYSNIKREETKSLLNRLTEVPEDISNISSLLLSRELEYEDFIILKKAFLELNKLSSDYSKDLSLYSEKSSYLQLFFQHFLFLSLKDDNLHDEINEFYYDGFESSFINDAKKSTDEFIRYIMEFDITNKEVEINKFMYAISLSHFKNSEFIYKLIFESLNNINNQFTFFKLISDENNHKIGKTNFGKLLLNAYEKIELNDEQNELLEKAKVLIEEQNQKKQDNQKNTK